MAGTWRICVTYDRSTTARVFTWAFTGFEDRSEPICYARHKVKGRYVSPRPRHLNVLEYLYSFIYEEIFPRHLEVVVKTSWRLVVLTLSRQYKYASINKQMGHFPIGVKGFQWEPKLDYFCSTLNHSKLTVCIVNELSQYCIVHKWNGWKANQIPLLECSLFALWNAFGLNPRTLQFNHLNFGDVNEVHFHRW